MDVIFTSGTYFTKARGQKVMMTPEREKKQDWNIAGQIQTKSPAWAPQLKKHGEAERIG